MKYTRSKPVTAQSSAIELDSLNRELEVRASAGEWADFGVLVARRDELLESLSVEDRADAFRKTLQCNENVLRCASADRAQAAERLDAFRQRRTIDAFYVANGGA